LRHLANRARPEAALFVQLPPDMFSRVLVATDFTDGAAAALDRALRLPLAADARIDVVHVIRPGDDRVGEDRVGEALEAELQRAREASGNRTATLRGACVKGKAFVEIIRAARRGDADLVVIGVHGARPFRDVFIGSTASRVVRMGDLPVLLVRRAATAPYRNALVAVALEDTDRRLVQLGLALTETAPAVVHAVHVPFESFQAPTAAAAAELRASYEAAELARTRASLADFAGADNWHVSVSAGDVRAVVLEEARRRESDLLVVGTHARSGIAHALLGSVAETALAHASCDVLVARPTRFTFELP
jgi:nucleotide-binding universal stress UspA family protein